MGISTVTIRCGNGDEKQAGWSKKDVGKCGMPNTADVWNCREQFVECPEGTVVKGLQTKIEEDLDCEDDTALNAARMICSTAPWQLNHGLRSSAHIWWLPLLLLLGLLSC
eukprot:TRINITY_DN68180_c3_g4_i1.p3 TRINITY_DN68180_c3_g4~~TRINITY_DN68180_c3_g4_i1.p3  ORF type:complete len:110 (-),score=18.22 TRINITY_DN68180_c3_g4_i1:311-640(-)